MNTDLLVSTPTTQKNLLPTSSRLPRPCPLQNPSRPSERDPPPRESLGLPMSDAAPETWGPVGKIQDKPEMVRARGHWVRGHPLGSATSTPTPSTPPPPHLYAINSPLLPASVPWAVTSCTACGRVSHCLSCELLSSLGGVDLVFHLRSPAVLSREAAPRGTARLMPSATIESCSSFVLARQGSQEGYAQASG